MTYGAIDFIALEFKNENLKKEVMPALLELVRNGTVRVIDLVIVQKAADGKFQAVEMQQLAPDMLAIFEPLHAEISGIIQQEDIEMLAEQMGNNTTAAALLFENLWSVKFKEAVLRAKGKLLMQVRLVDEDVQEAVAAIEKAEAKK
jgi:hypothetical protein